MSADLQLEPDFDLGSRNTLGLPSRARWGTQITDRAQLPALARKARELALPLKVIGGGSNLVLHREIAAVVGVMATRGIAVRGRNAEAVLVTAEAGENWADFVIHTVDNGLPGLENLAAIPGSVGAAPVQNIGAYGLELADRFECLNAYDLESGETRTFDRADCAFAYRDSIFKHHAGRYVVLDVTFRLPVPWEPVLSYAGLNTLPADVDAKTVRDTVTAIRGSKLPDWRVLGNAGSFFHNPVVPADVAAKIDGVPQWPHAAGVKLSAAWLIDAAGLKGTRQGAAGVYEKHALILVNHGGADHEDIAKLAARIREAVTAKFGVTLTQEPLEL